MKSTGVGRLIAAAAVFIVSSGAVPTEAQAFTLTITTTGANPGVVGVVPLGLCGPQGGGTCEFANIQSGTEVRLAANSPTTPGLFTSVTGSAAACALGTSTCTFVVTENTSATLAFNAGAYPSVTVTFPGAPGEVGVDNNRCQNFDPGYSACTTYYGSGSVVTLQARAPDSTAFAFFQNGTGDAGGCTTTPCAFTLTQDSTVGAKFTPCRVTPSVFGGTLSLNFDLGAVEPLQWSVWLSIQNHTYPLWSAPIPAIDPSVQFGVPIPGFPALGNVGVLTTLVHPSKGITCSSWRTVNTGAAPGVNSVR
jgi:hypothetical protein